MRGINAFVVKFDFGYSVKRFMARGGGIPRHDQPVVFRIDRIKVGY
jgi:hypothetical protein